MPVASPLYRMANRLAGDDLDGELQRLVDQGLSAEAIASRLYADHGIEASRPTVVAWLAGLPKAKRRRAPAGASPSPKDAA